MRILYIINAVNYGGAEKQLHERAAALARRDHSVGVISMMPFVHFEDSLRAAGVQTFTLGLKGRSTLAHAVLAYTRVLREFKPDVVHSHLFWSSMFARVLRVVRPIVRGPRAVLVCSSHSRAESSRTRYLAYRLTNRLGDAWTSVSREGIAVHEAAGAVPAGFARWTPNGIDLSRYAPDATAREAVRAELDVGKRFMWLALGSFHTDTKDYATMLRAVAQQPGSSVLLIGGEGALLEERRALAASLGLVNRVRFLGLRSDVERLFQAADAYVLSSQTEGMPNVLLQAAASGLPIVTTNVGEASAIVQDGRGGFVVEPRNPERLAEAMTRVEQMDDLTRRQFGDAARTHVAQHFDFARVVDRWEALYRELLAAKG
jgi:glycosyltransferase involved in cell wall biosynthesis